MMTTPHGHFHWNERMTRDPDGIMKFYGETLGWTFAAADPEVHGDYWVASCGGKPVGGIFPLKSPMFDGVPEGWMSYVAVDDVDARVEKAALAGAKLMRPLFDVPKVGRIAILAEPGGAGIGWIKPAS